VTPVGAGVGPVPGGTVSGMLATWSFVRPLRAVPTTTPEVSGVRVHA
jgi:hypothetical protein